ncbi:serine hydrolase domain-containing protein [Candidatus Latescibacterota bacterium]
MLKNASKAVQWAKRFVMTVHSFDLLLIAIVATLVTPASIKAQQSVPEVRVDSIFAHMDTPTSPGCALSVMRNGALIYERGYGMANLEYGIPITPQSVFHVASVSKHFTAMAVELLVNEGKVSWDDNIRDYVPEVPDFGTTITLRHLVHHVSGIRDQWNLLLMAGWRWEADVVTQKDVLDITSRQTALNFEPGSRFMYSNTGFTLLAVVVERVTGKSFREFTTERIFRPLGMENTHFHDDHQMIVKNRAWAYAPDEGGLYGLKNSIPDFDVVGATSLFTTVHDMAAWDRNFYTGKIGGKEALDRLHERYVLTSGDTIPYAHGLFLGKYRGLRTVSHSGGDAGYRSHFLRFPDQRFTITIFANFPSSNPANLARRVADIYLENDFQEVLKEPTAKPEDMSNISVSLNELKQLTGIYHTNPGNRTFRIKMEQDTLKFVMGPGYPLRKVDNERFELVGLDMTITLRPPKGSQPGSLLLPEQFDKDTYVRMDPLIATKEELRSFIGTYHSDELVTDYRFVLENDSLIFNHRKMASKPLEPAFKDAFKMNGSTVLFTRNPGGNVDGFTLSDSRVWNVRFYRITQ